jgi:hypothetical protein
MFPTFPFGVGTPPDPPQVLLATYTYDLDSVADAAYTYAGIKSAGQHCDGASIGGLLAADTLIITVNTGGTFVAWSPWGRPAITIPNSGSIWYFFAVRPDDSGEQINPMSRQNGYAAAQAVALANEPWYLTGDTEYWFGFLDSIISDNTGGCSITVQVWGNR